jgi:GxxExxY protein
MSGIDILAEKELVIEMKSLLALAPVHLSRLVSYLELCERRLGLLLNLNVESFKNWIYRRVNRL